VALEALRDIVFDDREEEGKGPGEARRDGAPKGGVADFEGARGGVPCLTAGLEALRAIDFGGDTGGNLGGEPVGSKKPDRPDDALRTSLCAAPQGKDSLSKHLPLDPGLAASTAGTGTFERILS
jgi:hypothetical protein